MHKSFADFITIEELFQAWDEFKKQKRKRKDVMRFERHLEDNLFKLHFELKNKTYKHSEYFSFYIQDPKQRHIHKASVRDRVVHHLLYNLLYCLFDSSFIFDSYSCRLEKGTHKGVDRLEVFTRRVSKNYKRESWALKLDVKKFFATVDHKILISILKSKINDKDLLWLLEEVISSFQFEEGKGIPLGNLTSQIFANIYLNKLDQFVKQKLKVKYYLRYADDFLILSQNKEELWLYIPQIKEFLENELNLNLHPDKIVLRNLNWGIDFLGYIVLPHYRLPRTKTKKRMFKKLHEKANDENFEQVLASYLGYLSHTNSFYCQQKIKNVFFQ